MRIAMVGPFGLHPNKTMRSRAFGLARPLVQRGHKVKIIMPPWQEPEKAQHTWQEEGVAFSYSSLSGGTIGIARHLIGTTLDWQPDIVHCFKPKAYSGLAAWWLWQIRRSKIRLVVDSDDWEGWGGWNERAAYTPLQKWFFSWQEQWGMAHCHHLTVASRALQSIAWSMGIAPEKVTYLPNGSGLKAIEDTFTAQEIEAQREKLGVGELPVLLLYSRLFEFDTARLVSILAGVKAAVPQAAFLLIGESLVARDAASLRQEMIAAGVINAVIDLGWVEQDQLPLLLSSADAAIYLMDDTLINRTKCPVKLADLVAAGTPVVAEAVGQVPEYILNGKSGFLRQPGDIENVVNDVVSLLTNEEIRSSMSAEARSHYHEHFSWNYLVRRLEQAYAI